MGAPLIHLREQVHKGKEGSKKNSREKIQRERLCERRRIHAGGENSFGEAWPRSPRRPRKEKQGAQNQ